MYFYFADPLHNTMYVGGIQLCLLFFWQFWGKFTSTNAYCRCLILIVNHYDPNVGTGLFTRHKYDQEVRKTLHIELKTLDVRVYVFTQENREVDIKLYITSTDLIMN